MKGISSTLVIIVTVIVVLVAALVVLTIFTGGVQPVVDITTQRNMCIQQAAVVCQSIGQLPPTWEATIEYRKGDDIVKTDSCKKLAGCECNPKTHKLTGCITNG